MSQFNVRMYPYYYAACSFIAWLPIFFLYFNSILSLKEVLLLEAIYYIAVVLLEVPTGYFSDVVGRKKTLVLGSVFLTLACFLFLVAGSFWVLVMGQLAFTFHMALVSGTNTVFHYESLNEMGQATTYGDREAIVHKFGMIAGGTAALVGGGVATFGLHYAYVVTLLSAITSLVIALKFKEPAHGLSEGGAMTNMIAQITSTSSYLKVKPLGWIFFFYILTFAITHVPYEFYQPYIQLLSEREMLWGLSVPVVSGLVYALARYLGAIGAAYSMIWSRKLGLTTYVMLCLLAVNLIVLIMGTTLHSVVILIVLFRSFPWAAIKAPINALITPAIGPGQRATFHSMLSLACRLTFFVTLLLLSFIVAKDQLTDWKNLRLLLRVCFAGGIILTIPLWWTARGQLGKSKV